MTTARNGLMLLAALIAAWVTLPLLIAALLVISLCLIVGHYRTQRHERRVARAQQRLAQRRQQHDEPEHLYDGVLDTADWREWADEMPPGLVERCQRAVRRELNRQKGGA